jgi:uncharacterized protein (UPF0248 family)
MQPLQDLLHRIRWDPQFGRGSFALGYEDRVAGQEIVVPLVSLSFDPERPGTFSCEDDDGHVVHVPLHRVRTMYKDGAIIWQRPRPAAAD